MKLFQRSLIDQIAPETPTIIDLILDTVKYIPETGEFIWKCDGHHRNNKKGKPFKLTRDPLGSTLCIYGFIFLAHRVAAICYLKRQVNAIVKVKDKTLPRQSRYAWDNLEIIYKDNVSNTEASIYRRNFIDKE